MNNKKLEAYLARLEKCLGSIAISEKAEIITEIKSHVLDAIDNDPDSSTEEILKSLGEPEQVASRYLLERGLAPQKPPKHPVVKWLVLGFLGTFAMCLISMFIIIFKFSPIVDVDEKNGTVKILGGLIDVKENKGGLNINTSGKLKRMYTSTYSLEGKAIKEVKLNLTNTKITVKTGKTNEFKYNCKSSSGSEPKFTERASLLDFSFKGSSKCEIALPKNISIIIDAYNGKFIFDKIENNVKLKAVNGKVMFSPNPNLKYNYNFDVTNGKIDQFKDSEDPLAYKVDISLENGKIVN